MKYVAELRFGGLGRIDRLVPINLPHETYSCPVAVMESAEAFTLPMEATVKPTCPVNLFVFKQTGRYPNKWDSEDGVVEWVIVYELAEITGARAKQ